MLQLLEQNKKYLMFIGIILMIGLITGIIYYILLNSSIKDDICLTLSNYDNFRYNAIIKDLIIMSLLLVTSIFVVGVPSALFYLFYESLSIGFLISIFLANFKLSGLIYILIYTIINKLLVLVVLIFFIKKLVNISRFIIGTCIYRRDSVIKNKLMLNLSNCMYLIVFCLIINILLYFISPSIFSNLSFLLK